MDWKKESEMFNRAADYYDRYRPGYPQEIIDALIAETGISAGSLLLEIGAGSGKATAQLAGRGYEILCIDPGADLTAIGNERFTNESIRFETARFEEYDLPAQAFDLIFAAQAFHWVPQPIGYERCAYALKDNAFLAPFWNMYVVRDNDMDNELLAISRQYGGFADFLTEEQCEERIRSIAAGLTDSRLFTPPKIIRQTWEKDYTAEEFYNFALTGNFFIQRSDSEKAAAREALAELANRHSGVIKRPYLCVLYLSQNL